MARMLILPCFLLAGVSHAAGNADKVTPVDKVIELLKKLSAKTAEEGKAEAKQYDDFSCFCKEQADEKLYNIETSTAKLEKLAAKISELEGEIAKLNSDISDLSTEISGFEDAIAATQTKEADEHADYLVERADVTDAISEVHGATEDLKHTMDTEKGDVGGVTLLALKSKAARVLELSSRSSHVKPSDAQLRTLSMLSEPGTAHGYEFHSGEIIQTMEGVEKTEKKERADLDEEEFKLEAALE